MKNVNELVEKTLFDVDRSKIEDYKEKMKDVILQLNSLIENTDFKINYTEFNSDKECENIHIELLLKLPKE